MTPKFLIILSASLQLIQGISANFYSFISCYTRWFAIPSMILAWRQTTSSCLSCMTTLQHLAGSGSDDTEVLFIRSLTNLSSFQTYQPKDPSLNRYTAKELKQRLLAIESKLLKDLSTIIISICLDQLRYEVGIPPRLRPQIPILPVIYMSSRRQSQIAQTSSCRLAGEGVPVDWPQPLQFHAITLIPLSKKYLRQKECDWCTICWQYMAFELHRMKVGLALVDSWRILELNYDTKFGSCCASKNIQSSFTRLQFWAEPTSIQNDFVLNWFSNMIPSCRVYPKRHLNQKPQDVRLRPFVHLRQQGATLKGLAALSRIS